MVPLYWLRRYVWLMTDLVGELRYYFLSCLQNSSLNTQQSLTYPLVMKTEKNSTTGNKDQLRIGQQGPSLVPRTGKSFGVILGFVLLLILLVANAWVTKRQLDVQIGDQAWVAHTQQVLFELSQTESLLKDVLKPGNGASLYTGDPEVPGGLQPRQRPDRFSPG